MKCDQVFEILTEGPFPRGAATDPAVESHLATCPSCARLAHALRPALDLFHEALDAEEAESLPEYWGTMADPSLSRGTDAEQPQLALATRTSTWSETISHSSEASTDLHLARGIWWSTLVGGALAASFFVLLAWNAADRADGPIVRAGVPQALASVQQPADPWSQLGLAVACRLPRGAQAGATPAATIKELACCTQCHSAGNAHNTLKVSVAKLAHSCLLCHLASR